VWYMWWAQRIGKRKVSLEQRFGLKHNGNNGGKEICAVMDDPNDMS